MIEPDPHRPSIIVLVRDLIFASKISSTAQALQVPVTLVRDAAKLQEQQGSILIVDLNLAGAISAAAGWLQQPQRQAIGFVSHVDSATIATARQAGITQIMPRSRFVEALPTLLQQAG